MEEKPDLGIGIVYFQGFETLLEKNSDLIHAIEVEPQTLWFESKDTKSYQIDVKQNQLIKSFSLPIVFHGVGAPVGGSSQPDERTLNTIKNHASELNPLWFSEHLSFNTFEENDILVQTNFLLPPIQTQESITHATAAIRKYQAQLNLPFAFETATNYLNPIYGDIPDGQFVAEIAEQADCNILLDLHNIFANEKNGRQSVKEFINQLPLERVSEIHLADGFFFRDYYLDAHSGISTDELFDLSMEVVKSLPNLKLIVFEMLPEYLNQISDKNFRYQLERMNQIWDARGKKVQLQKKRSIIPQQDISKSRISLREWERTLGKVVLNQNLPETSLANKLSTDKGTSIINELIFHFRASSVVTTLRRSTRLIRLTMGEEKFNELLLDFFKKTNPELFPFKAAMKFAEYVMKANLEVLYLDKILGFEIATLKTLADEKDREVIFNFNPFPVFRSLNDYELPERQDADLAFALEIKPDKKVSNLEMLKLQAAFHD